MNFVDIIVIIFLLYGVIIGFRRGFTRQLIYFLGTVSVVIFAFVLKNPLSVFLYSHLPFFGFEGILSGVSVINILIYEVIAFLILLVILFVLLRFVLFASKLFEKLLDMTIVLGIPSKILGALVGILENYIIVFILLYIITLPIFNINIVNESKMRQTILTKTPILNYYTDKSYKVGKEFSDLLTKYKEGTDSESLNLEALDLLLKYKVVTVKSVDVLVEKDKLMINNIESVLIKYRK